MYHTIGPCCLSILNIEAYLISLRFGFRKLSQTTIESEPEITEYWQECGTVGPLVYYCWEYEIVQPVWKIVCLFSHKTKHILTVQSSNYTPLYLPKCIENVCPHKNLHTDIFKSFVHNCQNLEVPMISFSRWMDIYTAVYPSNGTLFSAQKKRVVKLWKDMEKP